MLLSAGALVVSASGAFGATRAFAQGAGAANPAALPAHLFPSPEQLDSWIAILPNGTAEAFFGKMDMGQGLEVAIAQVVADELDLAIEHVSVRMGDTATTCNQGGASGSSGVSLGAKPLRDAAAEARRILVERAATVLNIPADQLAVTNGVIAPTGMAAGTAPTTSVTYADLMGGKHFDSQVEWNGGDGV